MRIVHPQNITYWDQINGTWNTHSFLHSSCIAQIPPFPFRLCNFLYCVSNLNRSLFFIAFSSFFPFSSNPVSPSFLLWINKQEAKEQSTSHSCFVVVWAHSFLASLGHLDIFVLRFLMSACVELSGVCGSMNTKMMPLKSGAFLYRWAETWNKLPGPTCNSGGEANYLPCLHPIICNMGFGNCHDKNRTNLHHTKKQSDSIQYFV